jgi:serine/threonine protein phosphatase PrpC
LGSRAFFRARNEDSAYVGRWLCAVADGMGGHAAGDIASATSWRPSARSTSPPASRAMAWKALG